VYRVAAAFVLLAGCSFQTNVFATSSDGPVAGDDAPVPDGPADAPIDTAIDAPPDAPPDSPPPPFCDPSDPTLVACYEFENDTADASGHNLNATNTNVTYVTGKVGKAAHAVGMTRMTVTQNALLDPSALTIECWIHAPIPGGGRAGIVDNDGDWGFFLQPNGDLQGVGLTSQANIPANTWTHVALTYDGTTRHYVNGVEVASAANTSGAFSTTNGSTGVSIAADNPTGSPLNGDIDQLRIFSVARTPQQIAADATP
jgi:hypothetical protein